MLKADKSRQVGLAGYEHPRKTTGHPCSKVQAIHLLNRPLGLRRNFLTHLNPALKSSETCAGKSLTFPPNRLISSIRANGVKQSLFCFCHTTAEMFMNEPSLDSKRKGNDRGMVYSRKWQHWNASFPGFGSRIDYKSLCCATYITSPQNILCLLRFCLDI